MPAVPFIDLFINQVSDGEKGLLDPYVQPVWSGIKNSIASLDLLKSVPITTSKVCKLSAYSASVVAYATGNSQFGSKLINYATKGDDIINASFLLCDGSHLIARGAKDWLDGMKQAAMLGAEMGGWALWLNSLGLIALTHTTAIAVFTGVSLCVGFAIIGYKSYQKLGSHDENKKKRAVWKTASAVSEVALHSLNVAGALIPAVQATRFFRVVVMGLGVVAAGTCIGSVINAKPPKSKSPDMNPLRKGIDYIKKATRSVTGVHRSAKWTISCINLAGLVSAVAAERFKALKITLTTFKGLIDGTAFLSRVKEWTIYSKIIKIKNDDGTVKDVEKGWKDWSLLKTLSRVGLTSGHFFKCLNFLDKVGIRKLGALSRTAFGTFRVVDIYGDGSILVNATFSIADTVNRIYDAPKQTKVKQVYKDNFDKWSQRLTDVQSGEMTRLNQVIQELKTDMITITEKDGKTVYKKDTEAKEYTILQLCENRVTVFEKLHEISVKKANWEWKKNWMTIANEVCKIAVISMAWITYGLGLGFVFQAAVSIIGFFTNTTGLGKFLIGEEINELKAAKKFEMPKNIVLI